jgi:hypothetical protein
MIARALFVTLALAAMAQDADAQVLYGSLIGSVTDPSGAPVPGVRVMLASSGTGQERRATTDEVGYYNFPTLPGGSYRLTTDRSGCAPFVRQDLVVRINDVLRVDVLLTVGAVTEQVLINAAAPVLQTDRADVHTDFSPAKLENLPIPPGRNFQHLLGVVPGSTPITQTNSMAANPARSLTSNINGTSQFGNNIRIDGASMNQVWLPNLATYIPALEAIDTVNVVTNSYNAEQGLAGGAAINVSIKSGTNALHGSAFEYHNDNNLKANPYFLPPGQNKPKYILNQFGGTIGGPIVHNKLFYFASYEGTFDRETGATLTTVPTAAIRAGDMSASPAPIYDPLTGSPDGSGRSAFPGNRIAAARQSPIVQKLIALTPFPNIPGALTNNYYAVGAFSFDRNTADAKLNYNASNKLTMYGRFGVLKYTLIDPPAFGPLGGPFVAAAGAFAGTAVGHTYSSSIGATYVATPHFIIDGSFGFSLLNTDAEQIRLNENLGADFLGIPGTNNGSQKSAGGWPSIQVANYSTLGQFATNWPIIYYDPSFRYSVNANWAHGTHNVRFGSELSRQHMNHSEYTFTGASGGGAGTFSFSGGVTTLRGGASPNQFNSYADFLLGSPSTIQKMLQPTDRISTRAWLEGLYVQDQWQVSRRFTLSYGVRWEYFPEPTRASRGLERYDISANRMLVCGVGVVPNDCGVSNSKRLFAPRLGIAYRATETFVIRAGYGITNNPYSLARPLRANYPAMLALSLTGPNTFTPAGSLAQGIPPFVVPDLGDGIISVPGNYVVDTLPNFFNRGYIQSWNFTLQKQLAGNWTAQAGYVATRQVRQLGNTDLNVGTPGGGVASQPFNQAFGRTASVLLTSPIGGSRYDSLQARIERRFSQGLQLNANYTWSKSMGICCDSDDGGSPGIQLPQYYNLNRSVLSFDRTHAFTFSVVYQLPFGRGKMFANGGSLSSKLFGGWQINALMGAYTGLPFSVSAAGTSLNAPGNTQRANQVKPSVQKLGGEGPTEAYYDPLAFAPVTTVNFGTAGFLSLRGPGYVNLDGGIFREFALREHLKVQFRMEAFNVTNTPHFGNPNGNVSNLQLNPDGSIRSLGGFMTISALSPVATSREGIDERVFRFGLRIQF